MEEIIKEEELKTYEDLCLIKKEKEGTKMDNDKIDSMLFGTIKVDAGFLVRMIISMLCTMDESQLVKVDKWLDQNLPNQGEGPISPKFN